jgi:hypothetical protein
MKQSSRVALSFLIGIALALLIVGCVSTPTPVPPTPPPAQSPAQPPAPAQLPDLEVTDLMISPKPMQPVGQHAELLSGTTYEFRIEVRNNGPGAVPGNVAVRCDFQCTSGCSAGILGQSNLIAFVGSVGIGATKLSQPVSITPDATGSYTLYCMVDPDNIYAETDESELSNVWQTTLIVR